ncbi:MAG: CpsD/CapB family tyrosine-protein kinase [Actinobacteria bacterium]|nr:CpsD/CapB family tyrosine-protein kinase [Actinomycetota bacterium]
MTDDQVELTFFTTAMTKRWYLPLGLALLGLFAGFTLAPATPAAVFEAETRVLIRPVTDSILNSNIRVDQVINEGTEVELASSDSVIRAALVALGDDAPVTQSIGDIDDQLKVRVRADSQIVVMTYLDADPDVAAAMVDALADAYLIARTQGAINVRDSQTALLAGAISASTTQLTAANLTVNIAEREAAAIADLERRVERLEEIVAIGQIQGDDNEPTGDPIAVLKAELANLPTSVSPEQMAAAATTKELVGTQISGFRRELVDLSTIEIDGGEVLDRAEAGTLVVSNPRVAYLAIGSLLGLMLGIMIAVMVERSMAARRAHRQTRHQLDEPSAIPFADDVAPGSRMMYRVEEPTLEWEPSADFVFEDEIGYDDAAESLGSTALAPDPSQDPAETAESADHFSDLEEGVDDDSDFADSFEDDVVSDYFGAANEHDPQDVETTSAPTALATATETADAAHEPESGLVVLADIPKIPRSAREPVVVTDPTNGAATALRRLALLVLNDTHAVDTPAIAVVSARAGEGKTTIAANMACAMHQEGHRVLLVTNAHQSVIAPGVHILPPGMGVGPDSVAPDDERLQTLLAEAQELVDIVIVDVPPILTEAEGIRISQACDRALIVGVSGKTPRADVDTVARLLEESGTAVMGLATTERPNWLTRRLDHRSVSD